MKGGRREGRKKEETIEGCLDGDGRLGTRVVRVWWEALAIGWMIGWMDEMDWIGWDGEVRQSRSTSSQVKSVIQSFVAQSVLPPLPRQSMKAELRKKYLPSSSLLPLIFLFCLPAITPHPPSVSPAVVHANATIRRVCVWPSRELNRTETSHTDESVPLPSRFVSSLLQTSQ